MKGKSQAIQWQGLIQWLHRCYYECSQCNGFCHCLTSDFSCIWPFILTARKVSDINSHILILHLNPSSLNLHFIKLTSESMTTNYQCTQQSKYQVRNHIKATVMALYDSRVKTQMWFHILWGLPWNRSSSQTYLINYKCAESQRLQK